MRILITGDRHTRRLAAMGASSDVIVCYHDFTDEDEAMDYAIANQRDRRNLTDAELAGLVMVVDKRKTHGGNRGNQYTGGKTPSEVMAKSSAMTAELAGTSSTKVEKIRAIVDYAEKTGDTEESAYLGLPKA